MIFSFNACKSVECQAVPLAIEVVNLEKVYQMGFIKVFALKEVSFSVAKGEFISIVGPSGSGKSTLLNMIGALDKPTKGEIMIDGIDITRLSESQLAKFIIYYTDS